MTTGTAPPAEGLRAGPARVSRPEVADIAVAVADADGLGAVTMRRVAGELGLVAADLYGLVPDKNALLDLMADTVLTEHELPAEPSGDGRADLATVARQQRAIMLRHPWLPEVLGGRPAIGPGAFAVLEFTLGALDAAGVEPEVQLETAGLLSGLVVTHVRAELARRSPTRGAGRVEAEAWFGAALSSGAYPRLTRRMHGGTAAWDADAGFERALDLILDALAR